MICCRGLRRKASRIITVTAVVFTISVVPSVVPRAAAEPKLIECPDNTHIWGDSPADCDYDSGITLGGGPAGGGQCGGICGILRRLPVVGGLF